jgi:hypothetical protein
VQKAAVRKGEGADGLQSGSPKDLLQGRAGKKCSIADVFHTVGKNNCPKGGVPQKRFVSDVPNPCGKDQVGFPAGIGDEAIFFDHVMSAVIAGAGTG